MSYKTILVQIDDSRHVQARVEIAASIAVAQEAHLIGAVATGVSRFVADAVATHPDDPAITQYLDVLRQRAATCLDQFEEQVRRRGVHSFERRLVDDDAGVGISLQARYCDLVVLGQSDPNAPARLDGAGIPDYVTMTAGTPVLIVPSSGSFSGIGGHALVAWNGSREAHRAMQGAMPLLQAAQRVEVVLFNPRERPDPSGAQPGMDVVQTLRRHGVEATLRIAHVGHGALGSALRSMATQSAANLLVMGCYGHTRFREMLLGGASREILESMTVPVLMAH